MHSVVLGVDDMKIEEAIKQLELNRPTAYTELREAIDMAIAAMEKQIPKKPYDVTEKQYDDFYYLGFICPSCNEVAVYQPYRPKFCKHCGQKIDWSEVKE